MLSDMQLPWKGHDPQGNHSSGMSVTSVFVWLPVTHLMFDFSVSAIPSREDGVLGRKYVI